LNQTPDAKQLVKVTIHHTAGRPITQQTTNRKTLGSSLKIHPKKLGISDNEPIFGKGSGIGFTSLPYQYM
jgi:hypothetical protein